MTFVVTATPLSLFPPRVISYLPHPSPSALYTSVYHSRRTTDYFAGLECSVLSCALAHQLISTMPSQYSRSRRIRPGLNVDLKSFNPP